MIVNLSQILFMKRISLSVCFLFAILISVKSQTESDSIPANPKDVNSIDAIVAAVYDVISGPAGQKRNWSRMRTLFVPDARMIATGKRQDGTFGKRSMNVEEYIKWLL
jgi:hypothetical protein